MKGNRFGERSSQGILREALVSRLDWRQAFSGERSLQRRVAYRLRGLVMAPLLSHRARQLGGILRCPGMLQVDPRNTDLCWTNRVTSRGERAVIEFLSQAPLREGPRILHLGIGTGELGRTLSGLGGDIVGITVAGGEISSSGHAYRRTHLVNKYELSELAAALGDEKFDWIVDVSLFSYACCWGHGMRFFWFLGDRLAEGGRILTHAYESRYAPTGHLLTPRLIERLSNVAGMTVTTRPDGVVMVGRTA